MCPLGSADECRRTGGSSKFDGVRAKALQGLSAHQGDALTTGDADDSGLGISVRLCAFDMLCFISLSFLLTLHSLSLHDSLVTSAGTMSVLQYNPRSGKWLPIPEARVIGHEYESSRKE